MLKVAKNAAWVAAFAVLVVFVLGMAATGSLKHPPPDNQKEPAKTESRQPRHSEASVEKDSNQEQGKRQEKSSGTIHSGSARLIGFSFFLMDCSWEPPSLCLFLERR